MTMLQTALKLDVHFVYHKVSPGFIFHALRCLTSGSRPSEPSNPSAASPPSSEPPSSPKASETSTESIEQRLRHLSSLGSGSSTSTPVLPRVEQAGKSTIASSSKTEIVESLRKLSPTGKLIDLFSTNLAPTPALGTSISKQNDEEKVEENLDRDVIHIIMTAVDNVMPLLCVNGRNVQGRIIQVPAALPPDIRRVIGVSWIVKGAKARAAANRRSKTRMAEFLALEILLAYQKKGFARQKRDEVHKLAIQSRANLHLKW